MSASLSLVSFKLPSKPISLVCTLPFSRFVRNVAISSKFGQEEDLASSHGDEELRYSSELKLFVGNLRFSVDSPRLAGLFENAAIVDMVEVIYDKVTGRSRGFGFVTMSSIEEVEAAAQQFSGYLCLFRNSYPYELEGRALRVNSGPPPQREASRSPRSSSFRGGGSGGDSFDCANCLYVGNLSRGVDNLALETLFSEKGEVKEAKSGKSRGFGFVTYSSAEEVENAIETLNGVELDGRAIRVSVVEARPRRQF